MNKLRIKKLGVLSVAKMYAVMMLVMGLLIGIPYGLIIMIYALFGAGLIGGDAALAVGGGGIVLGIAVMIGLPIFLGVNGFIGGAIGALLYNLFSSFVGGIEIDVESIA